MDTFFMIISLVASALLVLASIIGGVVGLDPTVRLELIQFAMIAALGYYLTASQIAQKARQK